MDSEPAVQTHRLTKRYGNGVTAVSELDLRVERGEVYGFLGLNGAGKTTTLRMLLGLIRPTAGSARVLGQPAGSEAMLARVGAMVETPAFYPYLTGYENLTVLARYCGAAASAVPAAVAAAGLGDGARRRFGTYSMGMRQRLGIGAAMLKNPELLILDEPTNGLDPAGMAAMRDLIRALAGGGRTVLLSSHLLGEVEQICDRVGVIRAGHLVAAGTPDELRNLAGDSGLFIRADPGPEAVDQLTRITAAPPVAYEDGWRVAVEPDRAGEINRELVLAGVTVRELRPYRASLEDVFLELSRSGTVTPAGATPGTVTPGGVTPAGATSEGVA